MAAEVIGVELIETADRARKEPAAERRVGNEADAELAQRGEDVGLHVAAPDGVLGLQRRDRVHRMGTADRVGRRLAEPEVAHLALRDELRHRADGLLDRRVQVDAVQVVQVDMVDAEALQRALDRLAHVVRRAVDAAKARVVRGALDPELRRELHLVAIASDSSRPP